MNIYATFKPALKAALSRIAPRFSQRWEAIRAERHGNRFMESTGVRELTLQYARHYGWTVDRGEFMGLKLLDQSVGSALLPKLIGAYEEELHPYIQQARKKEWDAVIDIGCAEGFYAVGLAKLLPGHPLVYAFDITPSARSLCGHLATQNAVSDRVVIGGACEEQELIRLATGKHCLIISDCEGFEKHLFTQRSVGAFGNCTLIIELHEQQSPGISEELKSRFDTTHDVRLVRTTERTTTHYPKLQIFERESERQLALDEFRSQEQQWLVATPKVLEKIT